MNARAGQIDSTDGRGRDGRSSIAPCLALAGVLIGLLAGPAGAWADPAGPPAPGRDSALPTDLSSRCEDGECPSRPALAASKTSRPEAAQRVAATEGRSGGVDPGSPSTAPPASEEADSIEAPGDRPAFVDEDPSLSGGTTPNGSGPNAGDLFRIEPTTVPNFMIDRFEIPPFLLPIYQACGSEYGIPWEVLASINRIETGFGTFLSVSSAGAQGWMQFMPATWEMYGLDANGDGQKDPYNPVDGICAAAYYLEASGYADDPYGAVFAYNHADWYVQDVLDYARRYARIPDSLITALTGLTEGARFPVAGEATYEGQISTRETGPTRTETGQQVEADSGRTSIEIDAPGGSPAIAVNDGVITSIDATTGTVVLQDVYGNSYRYDGLGSIARVHPVPRNDAEGGALDQAVAGSGDAPTGPAEMGAAKAGDSTPALAAGNPEDIRISEVKVDPDAGGEAEAMTVADQRRAEQADIVAVRQQVDAASGPSNTENVRSRVYANPLRPQNQTRASVAGESLRDPATATTGAVDGQPGDYLVYGGENAGVLRYDPATTDLFPLREGSRVIAGTVLGRLAETPTAAITFSIRPSEEDAPPIDPKPFLDGWRLLAETNIYNAKGKNRFADRLGAGSVLLLSKAALQKRVLSDPKISLGECDRIDIANGSIDRRVLGVLAYLSAKGYSLLISSMYCGRETSITTSGYVSNHSHGGAVDIAAINGEIVSAGTQGPGSLTDRVAREVLALQGTMAPDEVISLLDYPQPAGFAMGDHDDHLHVGYDSYADPGIGGSYVRAGIGAEQWERLIRRLGQIENPEIPTEVSASAIPVSGNDRVGRDR